MHYYMRTCICKIVVYMKTNAMEHILVRIEKAIDHRE